MIGLTAGDEVAFGHVGDGTRKLRRARPDQANASRDPLRRKPRLSHDPKHIEAALFLCELAVFNLGGSFRAYRNRCPHQLGPVCEGPLSGTLLASEETGWRPQWTMQGRVLLCPWHQREFDLDTGVSVRGRGEHLRCYRVERDGDDLYVQI